MKVFITLYLSVIFFTSGLAVRYGDRISYYVILLLPFFIYLQAFLKKEKIIFPKKLTLVWFGFSLFDLIATVLSLDHQFSIERFLLYQSAFLICVYFINKKNQLKDVVDKIIIWFAVIFTIAFIFKDKILSSVYYIDVNQAYNFFFPVYPNNNHLGIWLGMTIVLLFIQRKFIFVMVLAPFFLLSYSRSAYIGLFVTVLPALFLIKKWKKLLWNILILSFIVFILSVAIFVPRGELLSGRGFYFREALMGFADRPLFGYGPGNFTAISRNYAAASRGTFGSVAHNIFLDILSGSGIFAFAFFSPFIFLILKKSRKTIHYPLLIFLLSCFMITYIYAMPAVLILFFILAGLVYEEREQLKLNHFGIVFAAMIFIAATYLGYSEALYLKGDQARSLQIYPFRKEAYEEYMSQIPPDNKAEAYKYINMYKKNFPGVFEQLNYSANTYKRIGDYERSLEDFMTIYKNGTGFNPAIAREIHLLYLLMDDPVSSYRFSMGFVRKILSDPAKYPQMVSETQNLCIYFNKFFLDKGSCF